MADGGDPIGATFGSREPVELVAGNYIIGADTALNAVPIAGTLA